MNNELSNAQKLRKLRLSNGESLVETGFSNTNTNHTIDSYYRRVIPSEKIEQAVAEFNDRYNEIETQFKDKTGIVNKKDLTFLFLAIALQCIRQYVLTSFTLREERLDDKSAAKQVKGKDKEHSLRSHRYYNPSLEEIVTNPVPFDANIGANGVLSRGGTLKHRVTAIGHDPILGLVFGTCNIATSTITNSSFDSYHVTTKNKKDFINQHADTITVLNKTIHKLLHEGMEGKIKVATSLSKEIIHLKSDINSKYSLPLPIISSVDPKLTSKLADYGLDMANAVTFGKQIGYSVLINFLISTIHKLFYDDKKDDEELYCVRTRKILLYSNIIASSSNVIYSAITKDISKLDIGGLIVTLYRLISDTKFIAQIKYEYITNQLNKKYDEELKPFEKYFS